MDSEIVNIIQKKVQPESKENSFSQAQGGFKKISFITPELLQKIENTRSHKGREVCAYSGFVLGVMSLFSWVIILLGVLWSVTGIVLSTVGLRSSHQKLARIGLVLSVVGLIFSVSYVYAVYDGMVNYDYFTNEFWKG